MNQTQLPPLVKKVRVSLSVEAAFRRFTEQIAAWWPMETHSVGEKETVAVTFEDQVGGTIFETMRNGETSVWGTVLAYDAPSLVRFTWHPGREPSTEQEVEVRFDATDDGTEVTLTHSNWEQLGEAASAQRAGYDKGWDFVLGRYTTDAAA